MRTKIDSDYKSWEDTILNIIKLYTKSFSLPEDEEPLGLAVFKYHSETKAPIIGKQDIFKGLIEYRKHLRTTNKVNCNLTKSFATGQILDST